MMPRIRERNAAQTVVAVLVLATLVIASCERPKPPSKSTPKTSANSSTGPEMGADVVLSDADGRLVIFSATTSEAWRT